MREIDLDRYGVERRELGVGVDLAVGRYIGVAPITAGRNLYIYAKLHAAEVLRVQFHGRFNPGDVYPRFDGLDSDDAVLSFADPTVEAHTEVAIGWYLGGRGWDPTAQIIALVKEAAALVGATTIILTGGSSGGYAALRLGLQLPEALVYCFNAQTSVLNHHRGHVERYFKYLHGPEVVPEDVVAEDVPRYDLAVAYGSAQNVPTIFYAQSISDGFHLERHYVPFKRAMGVSAAFGPSSSPPGALFHIFDGVRTGHAVPADYELRDLYTMARYWMATTHRGVGAWSPSARRDDDGKRWRHVFDELARVRRELAEIQSGTHSKSLRRSLVSDLMGVMAMRATPVDRRPVLSGWAMSPVTLMRTLRLVEDAPDGSRIVEFGSGASTSWIADIVRRRAGALRFTSYEHDEDYFERTLASLTEARLKEHVELRLAPLEDLKVAGELLPWYSSWCGNRDVALAIIDGPPGGLGPMARFPAIAFIEARLVDGGIVVIDDYQRTDESRMVEDWNVASSELRLELVEIIDRAAVFRVVREQSLGRVDV